MRNRLSVKSQRGFSMISLTLAIALMGIGTIGILSWNNQKSRAGQQMNLHVVAEQIKQRLVGAVTSPSSWQVIQIRNTSAFTSTLLTTPSNGSALPTNTSQYPFLNIYLAGASTAYYQTDNPNAGFSTTGTPCATFNSSAGNDACPFHYDVRLIRHVYQNGNWIDTVHFELNFRPASSKMVLNNKSDSYTFDLVRNLDEKSVESSCISLQGQYNVATGACSVKITAPTVCNTGPNAYRGPATTANSQPCESTVIAPRACTGGQVIKGFDPQGNPQCASI